MGSLTDNSHIVTLREALDSVPLPVLMERLGFTVPERGSRTSCLICGGTNPTIFSFRNDGFFHCFRCSVSGGKLKLVEEVLKTDRRGAVAWLDSEFNLGLARNNWTTAQRRAWVDRRRHDERDRIPATWWRTGALLVLDLALESEKQALSDCEDESAVDEIGERIGTVTRIRGWVVRLRDYALLDAYRQAASNSPDSTGWLVSEGRADDEDAQVTTALIVRMLAACGQKVSE